MKLDNKQYYRALLRNPPSAAKAMMRGRGGLDASRQQLRWRLRDVIDVHHALDVDSSTIAYGQAELDVLSRLMIPIGFEITHNADNSMLTDEGNQEHRWCVKRLVAPFEDAQRRRQWNGPTLLAAMSTALSALKIAVIVRDGAGNIMSTTPDGHVIDADSLPKFEAGRDVLATRSFGA